MGVGVRHCLCAWAAGACAAVAAVPAVAQGWDPFAGAEDEAAVAAPIEGGVSGLAYGRFNSDLRDDRNGEQLYELRSKALIEATVKQANKWRAVVSGAVRYEMYPRAGDSRASFAPELWEAYGVWQQPTWDLSVGQQIRRWGRGVPSLWDVINPSDLSEFLFTEDEFQKLPVPMARWTYYGDRAELEVVALPFYRGARLPPNDSDWSLISVRNFEGADELPLVEQALRGDLAPGTVTIPQDDLVHGDLGLRVTPRISGLDVDAFVFYSLEDLPAPEFSKDFRDFVGAEADRGIPVLTTLRSLSLQEIVVLNPIYVQQPRRTLLAGGGVGWPLDFGVARAELLVSSHQSVFDTDLRLYRVPMIQMLLGFDRLTGERLLWSLSMLATGLVTDRELFLLDHVNATGVGLLRAKVLADRELWFEGRIMSNINLGDVWLGPSLFYEVFSGFQVQVGLNALEGRRNAPLAEFTNADFLWGRLRYVF